MVRYSFQNTRAILCVSRANDADVLANIENRNLIERYGADIRLPDLREEISKCGRLGQMHDACMVRYVDLVPR